MPADLFRDVPSKVLDTYRQRAAAEPPRELRRHPAPVRYTLLAVLCRLRGQEITDTLVELLIQLVHRIGARAERCVEKELLTDLRRVTGKTGLLFQVAEAALEHPDGIIKEVLWPVVGGERTLRDLVREYKTSGVGYRLNVQTHMRHAYRSYYRRVVPQILGALEFRSNNAPHRPVVRALELLREYAGSSERLYAEGKDVPMEGVVPSGWRELVMSRNAKGEERIDRVNYEICALGALREGLRSKEIWVVGADRYRNPDEDLLSDFDSRRGDYYTALRCPLEAELFVASIRESMESALRALDRDLPENPHVSLSTRGSGHISLSQLKPQPEPPNLGRLKAEMASHWPMTNLLDILKEADLRLGFTECFVGVASRESMDRATLQKRLLLCLYGLGRTPASSA